MITNIFAHIRVSTEEQNEDRQVIRMLELGIPMENIFIEKESGKSTDRKKFHRLVNRLKTGDTLYIENIDRLGRDYDSIIHEWDKLIKKGVIIKVLDTPLLDTDQTNNDLLSKFIRDFLLRTLAFQAESEWHKIKNRQAQGIAAAKANGKQLGRAKSIRTKKEIKVAKQYRNREVDLSTAMNLLGIKRSAFYNLLRSVDEMQK